MPEAHAHVWTPAGDELFTMATADLPLAADLGVIPADAPMAPCHRTAGCAPLTRLTLTGDQE